jgi:predicted Zn-dependent protease
MMEKHFNILSKSIVKSLKDGEHISLSFGGENSQYIRVNNAKIRQTGLVDESDLGFDFIHNNRRVTSSISISGNLDDDLSNVLNEVNRLRDEATQLPEDPYIVMPESDAKSAEKNEGKLLDIAKAADALLPAMQGVDFTGIWSSGKIFAGSANSAGGKHWFETKTFSMDYSLITPSDKMVKATFAGSKWNQADYENYVKDSVSKLEIMNRKPLKIKPGEYRTFIASAGVADILSMFSWGGVGEASIQQGENALGKMRHEGATLSPLFNLSEDFSDGLVPRFNGMGEIAPEKIELIKNGQLINTLISSRTAKEYGLESNFAGEGEGLRSPVMGTGDLDENDVLKSLGTGVYLSNLHYLNWSDMIGGRITGMTRYACFWVESGEIVAPIENMRFDDSLYNFLGENLEAVTSVALVNPDVGTYGGRELSATTCPGILLKAFALTL